MALPHKLDDAVEEHNHRPPHILSWFRCHASRLKLSGHPYSSISIFLISVYFRQTSQIMRSSIRVRYGDQAYLGSTSRDDASTIFTSGQPDETADMIDARLQELDWIVHWKSRIVIGCRSWVEIVLQVWLVFVLRITRRIKCDHPEGIWNLCQPKPSTLQNGR